jgi:hypothetical protein
MQYSPAVSLELARRWSAASQRSDGYAAYAHDVAKMGIIPAPCWAPARRGFFEALAAEPEAAAEALALIGELYSIEEAADPGAGRCP